MISADTNIFVYAVNEKSLFHSAAVTFLSAHATNPEFAICELVLVEVYMCLRNPAIFRSPLSARGAVEYCDELRANPHWQIVDWSPDIQTDLWAAASEPTFPYRRIIDARLALTLKFHGVDSFATTNVRDFEAFGFQKLWNPLAQTL